MEKDATYYQACSWAQAQLASGTHPEALVTALKNQGWQEFQAREVLDGAIVGDSARPKRVMAYATPVRAAGRTTTSSAGSSHHASQMMIGGAICAVGVVITVGTYSLASSSHGGGTYLICWGPVIFGGIRFIKGFVGWTSGG